MSGEQISIQSNKKEDSISNKTKKRTVNINVLLNRVRADQKKERIENVVLFSLVSLFIIVTGVIISL